MNKEERAEWLKKTLSGADVPMYGRASTVAKELNCAKAAATGWLNGSLPRDIELAYRVCEYYKFDLREWVYGIPAKADHDEWGRAISIARAFESNFESLDDDQFFMIVKLALKSQNKGQLPELLEELGSIIKK